MRIADSNFTVSTTVAAALVTMRPGRLREMHWRSNADEWQYWIKGKGQMTPARTPSPWISTRATSARSRRTADIISRTLAIPICSFSKCSELPISQMSPFPTGFPSRRHRWLPST
ncbi:cupin domain-containing protein [Bradyrhizobium sp. SRL28]|uniref:cupin domain-containing protein n=1 Tax=Bradyrhizobium sp. SRL28 TaxID=2836178 RepID=UPI0027DEBC9C|nr:cupin domain-containing protein [Bradyrhizobium sp. SRL28]